MIADKSIVPSLMFHSVGLEDHPWTWSYISESIESFEEKISRMKDKGFTGVFWNDVYEHMAGRRILPDNSIFLTFDDGYLDNWVYVYPILKKYGMKGTIFVSPEFVDPAEELRPTLEDVQAGRCSNEDLSVAGFLNWAEMRAMEASGVIDIQSHAMTHTWYFTGPKIVDFHRPHAITPNPWLFWNARLDCKPFYLNEDQQEYIPWGFPILEHKKSLLARRFFPNENQLAKITDYVASNGGKAFFHQEDWAQAINAEIASELPNGELEGRYESDEERAERIRYELERSKVLIERNLGKGVDYICWPGGANDEIVQRTAAATGFKSWTLSSSSELNKRNQPGTDPTTIKRIGTSNGIVVKGRRCGTAGPFYQMWRIFEHQGSLFYSLLVKAYKLFALIRHGGGIIP